MSLCASCTASPNADTSPTTTTNESAEFADLHAANSFVWHPNVHADLASSEGTFLRAYTESAILAYNRYQAAAGYPGFEDATDWPIQDFLSESFDLDGNNGEVSINGTQDMHVVRLDRQSEQVTANICVDERRMSIQSRKGGRWRLEGDRELAIREYSVTFSTVGKAPPAGLEGGPNAPNQPIFGQWKAKSFDYLADFGTVCNDLFGIAPNAHGDAITIPGPLDPAHPEPGWPDASIAG